MRNKLGQFIFGNISWSKINKGKYRLPDGTGEKISKKLKGRVSPTKGKHIIHSGSFKKGQIPWNKDKEFTAIRGEKNSRWKGGKPKCKKCGKQLTHYNTKLCFKCNHELMVGKLSPNWLGGKSLENYTTNWTETLKTSIRQRDGYACQFCGKHQENKSFSIHHIDYDKKNCNPNNLITLCKSCHTKTNFNRSKWLLYFKKNIL
jgi:5-methylcytosine-specific restriction endonuclease McrA